MSKQSNFQHHVLQEFNTGMLQECTFPPKERAEKSCKCSLESSINARTSDPSFSSSNELNEEFVSHQTARQCLSMPRPSRRDLFGLRAKSSDVRNGATPPPKRLGGWAAQENPTTRCTGARGEGVILLSIEGFLGDASFFLFGVLGLCDFLRPVTGRRNSSV